MSASGSNFDVNLNEKKWPQYPNINPGDGLITVFLAGEDYSYNINIENNFPDNFYSYWYTWASDSSVIQADQLYTEIYGTFAMGDGNDTIINAVGEPGTILSGYFLGGPGDDMITNADWRQNLSPFAYGGSGSDTIQGTGGNDSYYGDEVDYYLFWPGTTGFRPAPYDSANDGADSLDGGDGNDTLVGGGGDDTLSGGDDDDLISATSGNNQLFGGEGADTITGGTGNDFLYGGPRGSGNLDVLNGGGGADVFLLSYAESANDGAGFWTKYFEADSSTVVGGSIKSGLAQIIRDGSEAISAGFLAAGLGAVGQALAQNFLSFLFSLVPSSKPQEDVLVIRDFDPSQDVLVLPTGAGVDLSESWQDFNPDGAGDVRRGLQFTDNITGKVYAEVTLGDDFLASVGLTQDDKDDIKRILEFIIANPAPIDSGTGGFSTLSNLSAYLSDGGFKAPGQALPAGTSVDLFGAIGGLVYMSEPGPTPANTFLVGTVYSDILTINPTILLPDEYVENSDTMNGTASEVHGLGGDDIIYGGNGSDILHGGDGNDLIYSFLTSIQGENVSGGAGDDTIYGGGSYGVFDGGDGVDTFGVIYIPVDTGEPPQVMQLFVDLTSSTQQAGERTPPTDTSAPVGATPPFVPASTNTYILSGFENVIGGPVNDWIRMAAGGTVEGGAGADYIDATAGGVTFSYASSGLLLDSPVLVQLFATDTVTSGGDAEGDVLDYEGGAPAGLIGSGSADTLGGTATGATGFTFTGGGGADLFQVLGLGDGLVYTITDFSIADGDRIDLRSVGIAPSQAQLGNGIVISVPGGGVMNVVLENFTGTLTAQNVVFASSVNGFARADLGGSALSGGEGDDMLRGRGSLNFLNGNGGDDSLFGDSGRDMLDGGSGRDLLRGWGGDDRLSGGDGDDSLFGAEGNDRLLGGAGNDSAWGGEGADFMLGGAGDDVLRTGNGGDTARGEAGNDSLLGGNGSDVLDGGAGNDTVAGGAGNDLLRGGAGADVILGGDGDDTIEGGAGPDLIRGGAGADLFRFVFGTAAGDAIVDFLSAEGDRLVVESTHPVGVSHLGGWRFVITDGFTFETVQVRGATLADFDLLIG